MKGTPTTQTILIGVALSMLVGIGALLVTASDNGTGEVMGDWDGTTFETQTTGSMDSGDVEIALTPAIEEERLVVETSLDTHTEDLGQHDLMEQTTLEVDGTVTEPTDAPSLAGHHPSGSLVFDLDEPPESFTITITDIPDDPERVYDW